MVLYEKHIHPIPFPSLVSYMYHPSSLKIGEAFGIDFFSRTLIYARRPCQGREVRIVGDSGLSE